MGRNGDVGYSGLRIRPARAYQWQLKAGKKCCVIGGCGFLGRHITEKLLEKGYMVNVFDIRSTFEDERISFYIGDLCKKEDLLPALKDVYMVIHVATPPPLSDNRALFHKVNVEGTQKILEACKESKVERFVLTSSASVVYEGKDIENGDEDLPYASKPMDGYTETKIIQEKLVLEMNGQGIYTTAIRPHGIFGPRDPHMLPTTVRMARAGKTKFIIGNGKNLVDWTYVENVAYAHVLAGEQLSPDSKICGKAYNITNDEPIFFWTFMSRMLVGLGYPSPYIKLPFLLIYVLSMILQFICILLKPIKVIRPTFTPMTVCLAGSHHYYSCKRAKEDMGYKPPVPLDRAILNTVASFPHLKKGAE